MQNVSYAGRASRSVFGLLLFLFPILGFLAAGEDCNVNGRPDSDDVAPKYIGFGDLPAFEAAGEGEVARGPVFADLDGDGNLDAILIGDQNLYFLRNLGDGTFEAPMPIWYGIAPSQAVAMDLDQNGSSDVAYWEGGESSLIVFRNRGDGTFADVEKRPLEVLLDYLTAANLDHDAAPDLVLTGGVLSGNLAILRNDGQAGFALEKHVIRGCPSLPLVADLNGDRDPDILVPTYEQDLLNGPKVPLKHDFLYRNNGDGTFSFAKDFAWDPFVPYFAADFDGDGDVDLADGYNLLRNRGDASFAEGETLNSLACQVLDLRHGLYPYDRRRHPGTVEDLPNGEASQENALPGDLGHAKGDDPEEGEGRDREQKLTEDVFMARRKRNYKFSWKSKRANHGRKGARGKLKNWGKKN